MVFKNVATKRVNVVCYYCTCILYFYLCILCVLFSVFFSLFMAITLVKYKGKVMGNGFGLQEGQWLAVWIWGFTQRKEIYYRVVHLQHCRTLAMHHGQTGSSTHCIIWQTSAQYHERVPNKNKWTNLNFPWCKRKQKDFTSAFHSVIKHETELRELE